MENVYPFVLTKVINGDTIEGAVNLGFGIVTTQRFRLQGVVAPSFHSKDKAEIERAKASKMWLQSRLLNKKTMIKCFETGKFGKYLAVLYVEGSNVNEELFSAGHVARFVKSHGGKDANQTKN